MGEPLSEATGSELGSKMLVLCVPGVWRLFRFARHDGDLYHRP